MKHTLKIDSSKARFIGMLFLVVIILSQLQAQQASSTSSIENFYNTSKSVEERAQSLIQQLSLEEKVSQLQHVSPAIPRFGIPSYNWWNECLHGVARNGIATVFPQAIGMAATWNPQLIYNEADVISTEARAKYKKAILENSREIYQGLTFWSPNINIFRDPRWGRGQETYGEDPFLTATIGTSFVKGLQGDNPTYFKVIATAKHFAVHSGPESERHRFDAWPSKYDLHETYLPAFEALIKNAKVYSVMSCYNRVYGTPSSANTFLFKDILREKWKFNGYVVSDCWAISDMYSFHNYVPSAEKAAALSLLAGVDLSCGPEYGALTKAVQLGYVSEKDIDNSVAKLFVARLKLGMFDPDSLVPYATISSTEFDLPASRELALKVARESIVLLKNSENTLPLSNKIKRIAVMGPYANDTNVLLGNYNGTPSSVTTLLQGVKNTCSKNTQIIYSSGVFTADVEVTKSKDEIIALQKQAFESIKNVDVVIFCGGISPLLEGEELQMKIDGFFGGDRTHMNIPLSQLTFLKQLKEQGKKVILVLTNGSALSLSWEKENLDAIIEAWYPGEEGGKAVADVIFGRYNPAGRLPVTFYKSVDDLPDFTDYSMQNRTYKYFKGSPLFAFGHGLSYSTFMYSDASCSISKPDNTLIEIKLKVRNSSKIDGDEVVQVYVKQPQSVDNQPIKALVGFKRVAIKAGNTSEVSILLPKELLRHFDSKSDTYTVAKGEYEFQIGASSDDIRLITKLTI